jgi:hypothetical protein
MPPQADRGEPGRLEDRKADCRQQHDQPANRMHQQ